MNQQKKKERNFFSCYDYEDSEPEYKLRKKNIEPVAYHYEQ